MTNPTIPQVMASLGLDYSPALQASEYFRRDAARTNATLIEMRQQSLLTSQAMKQHFGLPAKDLQSLNTTARDLGRSMEKTTGRQVADASRARTDAFKRESLAVQDLAQKQYHLSQQLSHRMGWFLGGAIFYGGIQTFGSMAGAIRDVELGMVQIKKVMNDASADFDKLQQQLIDMAVQYGVSVQDTLEVATLWARAGYRTHEILDLVKTSLLGISVAELSANDSVRLLISGLKQFNMTADESHKILDAVNEISNNFSVNAKDLLEALSVSGQVAKNAGIDFHTLLGYITSLSEATGRAGRELGNSVKSIIAFSQRPKAIEVFEQLGVHVVDAKGYYRDFTDVFTELSEKWTGASIAQQEQLHKLAEEMGLVIEKTSELTDVEKTNVSAAAANMFRRNMFVSLMENYTTALNATETGMRSAGSAEQEMSMFMESAYKKTEQLKASMTALAVEIGQAGLLAAMKGVTDETRYWVESFTKLPEPVKTSVIVFGELTMAIALANLASRTFVGIGMAGALKSWAAAATGAQVATMGLGTALSVLARNPIFLTVTGITVLVGALRAYNKSSEQNVQKTIESMQAHQMAAEQFKAQKEQIEKLAHQYGVLSQKTELSASEQERLNSVMAEIASTLPGAIEGYDQAGNVVLSLANVTRVAASETARLTAEMKVQAEAAAEIAKARLPFLEAEKAAAATEVLKYTEALRSPFPRGELLGLEPRGYMQLWETLTFTDDKARQRLSDLAQDANQSYGELNKAVAEAKAQLRAGEVMKAFKSEGLKVSGESLDGFTAKDVFSGKSKPDNWATAFSGSLCILGAIIIISEEVIH
ncbi:MAG: phage tail tape measure protein [Candidatus Desulforudis sp.]|nr:phage tail tape measure protein [Desulforudis sp.]